MGNLAVFWRELEKTLLCAMFANAAWWSFSSKMQLDGHSKMVTDQRMAKVWPLSKKGKQFSNGSSWSTKGRNQGAMSKRWLEVSQGF